MDLKKEYLIQCLITASNNLRLTSEKIEMITILKDYLLQNENVTDSINTMKKVTQLSKFAIRLSDVNMFICGDKIDFFKISEVFKQHSHNLVIELSNMLETVNPEILSGLLKNMNAAENPTEMKFEESQNSISNTNKPEYENGDPRIKNERDKLKESIIFEDMPKSADKFDFKSFEDSILAPIRELDSFLGKLVDGNFPEEDIDKFINLTSSNFSMAKENGFDILANMNMIINQSLNLIKDKKIIPNPDVVEKLRACLIVIVAVVRSKNVDITSYLNKAEKLGREISELV